MTEFSLKNKAARKLSPGQVEEMRRLYAQGATQGALCRHFGVSIGQVGRIVRGESWTDLGTAKELSPNELAAAEQRALQAAREQQLRPVPPLEAPGTSAPRAIPPSPLDGADLPAEVPAMRDALNERAAAYGLDIERLRSKG